MTFHRIILTFKTKNGPYLMFENQLLHICIALLTVLSNNPSPINPTAEIEETVSFYDNCGLVVDAGPDKLVCPDDPNTILDGRVSGSGLREFEWSPPDGLSSTKVLRPSVNVSGPQCYVLTAKKKGVQNLITNGNFESGPTGFTTDYVPGTMSCFGLGFLDCAGTYAVLTNPQLGHANFSACGDHTSGSGNMMVCNGAPGFVNVWCQTVAVTPDRDYCISAWATSVNPESPAQLEYSINGTPLGFIGLSGSTCVWEQLQADWNSGGTSIATICIVNQNTAGSGNDFAIDDIEMFEICEQYDTVCVDIVDIQVAIQDPPMICCDEPIIQLDGTGSSMGPDYTYCWTASNGGHIVSGEQTLMPFVDKPGTYTLTVKGPEGCTIETEVEVEGNLLPPKAYAEVIDSLDCNNTSVELFGGAFPDDNVNYEWRGPNGFSSTDPSPNVMDTGTYVLTVTDICGCFSVASVTVHAKEDLLSISIIGDSLDCNNSSVNLIADSNDPNAELTWSGPNGYKCEADTCMVQDTGWYILRATSAEGCIDGDSFYVSGDLTLPDILLMTDTIDCTNDSAHLQVLSRRGFEFSWQQNGLELSSDTLFSTIKNGIFTVIVTGRNGCIDSAQLFVPVDTTHPKFEILGNDIPCDSSSTTICWNPRDTAVHSILWTTPSGATLADSCFDSTEEGWYLFSSRLPNGCLTSDSLHIKIFDTRPTITLPNGPLNCHSPTVTLKHLHINDQTIWTLPNGNMVTGDSLVVQEEGWYKFFLQADSFECPLYDSVFISEDFSTPIASLNADTLTCMIDSVIIELLAADTLISTTWSGPQGFQSNDFEPVVYQPGAYEVVVTGLNGCSDTLSIEVLRSAQFPNLIPFSDTINCLNPVVDIGLIADRHDLDYTITDPRGNISTDSSLSTSLPGIYNFEVVTMDGCTLTRQIEVTIDTVLPIFQLLGKDTINCLDTTIALSISSADGSITYAWTGPGNFSSSNTQVNIGTGGIYHVSAVGRNGCPSHDSIRIIEDTIRPLFSISGDTVTCSNPLGTISVSTQNSNTITWLHPNMDTSYGSTTRSNISGLYNIIVTGRNGCQSYGDFDLLVDTVRPDLLIHGDTITCYNPQVWINAVTNAGEIQWSGNGVSSISDSVLISQPGVYRALATATNDCSTIDSVYVGIDTMKPDLTILGDSITCARPRALLFAVSGSGNLFNWSSHNNDSLSQSTSLNVTKGGIYNVSVLDIFNGCESVSSIAVDDLRDLPMPTLQIEQPDCNSFNGDAYIESIAGGNPPYTFSLNNGPLQSSRNYPDLTPGQHEIYILDKLGCEFRDTFEIKTITIPVSNINPRIDIELGDSVILNLQVDPDTFAIKSVTWFPSSGLSCDTCFNPVAYPQANTDYLVELVDTNGCVQVLEVFIKVNLPQIFVPNVFSPNGTPGINDTFYPFSSHPDRVFIDEMQIFSRWGEQVFVNKNFHPDDPSAGWNGALNDESMNPNVFAFIIFGHYLNGKEFILSGDVTIVD